MAKKVFTDESLATLVSEIKTYTDSAVSTKANSSHNHAASNITSGTLSSDRLPTVPIAKGGTGATDAATARQNLGVYSTSQIDNQITTFSNTLKTYTDNSVSNHNHDSKYDTKGAADASLSSGKAYTDEKVGELDSGFSEVILTMIGNDITEDGVPTIRSIAADEANNVQTNLDTHKSDTTKHITSTERTTWNNHVNSAHAPSNAQPNQNAFSNVAVGSSTIAADSTTDTLTIEAGTGISVSADTTNDKVTITNSGVRSISTGTSNGTISVNTNGTSTNVAVKGLGNAAYTASTAYDAAGTAQTKADAALASAKTYTDGKIDAIVGEGASTTLDTIGEISAAIEAHQDVTDALNAAIGNKVDKVSGKGLSTNDLTATLKSNYDTAYSHVSNKSNPHGVTLSQLGVNATATELNYVDGVTSSIQTQLDSKQATITGGATTITGSNLTASRALVSDSSGKVAVSAVTSTELGYLDGVTSSVQTQLDGKAASGHTHIYYGECSTAADTVAKTVTVPNFKLETGAMVIVKFTNANSASSPTLNVSGTGAKSMCRYDTTAMSTGTSTTGWRAGAVQQFIYDGTSWVRDFWENTTYSNASLGCGYATCSTAAATTAKTASLSSYSLTTGGIVAVKFTYAVPASATLNINSKGAKKIYYRGAAITAGIINAGDIATFVYNGSQYHLISIDSLELITIADIDTICGGTIVAASEVMF